MLKTQAKLILVGTFFLLSCGQNSSNSSLNQGSSCIHPLVPAVNLYFFVNGQLVTPTAQSSGVTVAANEPFNIGIGTTSSTQLSCTASSVGTWSLISGGTFSSPANCITQTLAAGTYQYQFLYDAGSDSCGEVTEDGDLTIIAQ
jgi:hypothetical protein